MLEGKFRDKTHLGCGYPLYLATPVSIAWFETGYFAKCPRCLADLPVKVKPSSIPKRKFKPIPRAEVPIEPISKPEAEAEPAPVAEAEPAPEVFTEVKPEE